MGDLWLSGRVEKHSFAFFWILAKDFISLILRLSLHWFTLYFKSMVVRDSFGFQHRQEVVCILCFLQILLENSNAFFYILIFPPFLIDGSKESFGIFSILPGNLLSESTSRSVFVYACMDVCIYLYICLWNDLPQHSKVYLFTDSSDNFVLCILDISKPITQNQAYQCWLFLCAAWASNQSSWFM